MSISRRSKSVSRLLTLIALLGSVTIPVRSPAQSLPSAQEEEYLQLLELLEEQTSIATKTRLNADYVPGMVTVLHGKNMEATGSRTVWEALAKVPGIELSMEGSGRKQVVVRGLGRTYASGNVKFMLDGQAMNSAQTAYATPLLNIPVEQVERIEIIRGPGSAVHGEFAYSGVINVITRKNENKLFLRAAEGGHTGGGGLYHYRDPDSDLEIALNVGHWQEEGVTVTAGKDALYAEGLAVASNAPGPTNEAQQDTTALLTIKKRDYRLNLQWLEDGIGDYFGINEFLPPDEKKIVTRYRTQGIELSRSFFMDEKLEANARISWLSHEEEKDGLFAGNAAVFGTSGEPFVVDTDYREERIDAGLDVQWNAGPHHHLLVGYNYSYIEVKHNDKYFGQDGGGMTPFDGFIDEGKTRHINSLTLQDEYHPGDKLTFTLGLRHDTYSDAGSSTTPRIAAVYRMSRMHILKAQYARAFRPPTFYELGGKIDAISPSTIETLEAGYIYRGITNDLRLTLFRSNLKDPITFIETHSILGFTNTEGARQHGGELEWNHRFNSKLSIKGNLSYLQTEDESTGEPLAGSADWLANLGVNFRPNSSTRINLQYRYTGEVHRAASDSRAALDAYNTLDLTFSRSASAENGYHFRIGVKNLLNEEVRYPAPANSYMEDYPRPERIFWTSLSYQF